MIYVDTSSVLAEIFQEPVRPAASLWTDTLVSSRLTEYEVWVRVHAYGSDPVHVARAKQMLGGLALLELTPEVLDRALKPFPRPVRTLDALHLASADYLRTRHGAVSISTLDARMRDAALDLHLTLV